VGHGTQAQVKAMDEARLRAKPLLMTIHVHFKIVVGIFTLAASKVPKIQK